MGEKIIVGPVNKGLRNDRLPFVIDNDSFPQLINAYQWRGRIKRKRGTSLLGRLTRFFNSTIASYGSITSFNLVGGAGNLLTAFSLQANGNIVPGSGTLTDSTTGNVYTDNSMGVLTGVPAGTGTINYATGAITIAGGATDTINTVSFFYTPDLPVMGLEDFISTTIQFPGTLAFDTVYSYNIQTVSPYGIYDVSFYKNPITGVYPGYIQKTVVTPTTWNGQDYQQFWTTNYQNALWATNGIDVPFTGATIGMQFKPIVATTSTMTGPPAIVNIQITAHGLSVGDFLFINETATAGLNGFITAATQTNPVVITSTNHGLSTGNTVTITGVMGMTQLNGNTYTITVVDANNVTVEFPNATISSNSTGGIAQYLTNRSNKTLDSLRWYDGDPTNGSASAPLLTGHHGWVNFAPPISRGNMSIADLPATQYYLVGARIIMQFKDRLLFFGPIVQTSAAGSQEYLPDTIIYSQNGTPYYTPSFTGDPSLATTVFNPILVPANQTGTPNAYWGDQTGYGGFITAGLDQEILTVGANEDVLIVGFTKIQTRLIYSGNDLVPFNFYIINSELGSGSTFSAVTMDQGVETIGSRGFVITGQTQAERFDLEIPDEIFEFRLLQNGSERVTAQRDFINEWIYFTYPVNTINYRFPTQTLQYNYRDASWGIFRETYTAYGAFRRQTGFTWATAGDTFGTWNNWNQPWNEGDSTLLQPEIIAGNQQGFVLFRVDGTNEGD